jgi:hypothetical protein
LEEENEIPVQLSSNNLKSILSEQVQYSPEDTKTRRHPFVAEDGYATLQVLHHPDGSAYVKVVPVRLGRVLLEFTALFSDGGFAKSEMEVNVVPPARSPKKLIVSEAGVPAFGAEFIEIPLSRKGYRTGLSITAVYGETRKRTYIDPRFASFEVRNDGNGPVIEVNKETGEIRPLRLGEALVVTHFGDMKQATCVSVVEDFEESGPKPNCASLLRAGETLQTPIVR